MATTRESWALETAVTSATASSDIASRVWAALNDFVTGQDRRRVLRSELGLGLGKVEVLIRLLDGPMNLREIARAVDVDPPAATVGVDQLERRNLVQRAPHPDDKRQKLVHLTETGRATAARAKQILQQPPAAVANLTAEDLVRLDEIVTRLTRPEIPQTET